MDNEEPKWMSQIRNEVDAAVRATSETAGQWTLGGLIDALKRRDPKHTCRFGFGYFRPSGVSSYRGHYDQLAIEYSDDGSVTVADVLVMLEGALGAVYEGYKGGNYKMTRSTMVWVANHGEAPGTAVLGIEPVGWCTIIRTGYVD